MPDRRTFLREIGWGGSSLVLVGLAGCDRANESLLALLAPEPEGDRRPPDGAGIDAVTHVLNRVAWGPRPGDYRRVEGMGIDAFIDEQLHPETIADRRCELRVNEIETLQLPRGELYECSPAELQRDLARAKLLRCVYSRRQLLEVMADFWSDHLNIAAQKGECRWMRFADEREVVRPHALGRFRDLIRASAVSPAMLVYLDGHDNKVVHPEDRPNENYARELLELHTLGVHGGYTQRDVMEAARCLSGWTYGHDWRRFFTSRVAFDPERHDRGEKEVLGIRVPAGGGADDLDRLLDILCAHPSTARHIAAKLVRAFVGDPPPPGAVSSAAAVFASSGGDVRATLGHLLRSPEFAERRGNLFKRPQRFVVSALRAIDARTNGGAELVVHLRRMGQAPYEHPSPDGYPLEQEPWIATLLWRWNFALDLVRNRIPGTRVDRDALAGARPSAGSGWDAPYRNILGRSLTPLEREVLSGAGDDALALALAAPAFQWH
ncbi:MAG: DUF1800 domain-containing protein [Phycisphaerales bacterium]|nr:DUF1800 domain-containing protein [Phycisphaerales bacterium]